MTQLCNCGAVQPSVSLSHSLSPSQPWVNRGSTVGQPWVGKVSMNLLLLLPSERRKGDTERSRSVHSLPSNSPIRVKAFHNLVASLHPLPSTVSPLPTPSKGGAFSVQRSAFRCGEKVFPSHLALHRMSASCSFCCSCTRVHGMAPPITPNVFTRAAVTRSPNCSRLTIASPSSSKELEDEH